MDKLFFWKEWPKHHRLVYQFLMLLLLVMVMVFGITYTEGDKSVMPWVVNTGSEAVEMQVDIVEKGLFQLPILADSNLLLETFAGSPVLVNFNAAYVFLAVLAFAVAIALAVVVTFNRFWFLVSMGVFTLFLLTLNFDLLELFGRQDRTGFIVALLAYFPLAYFFHVSDPKIKLGVRIFAFVLVGGVLASLVYSYANVAYPFLSLINYGLYAPLIITAIFIFMVSHEIMHGFLYLITRFNTERSSNSLSHFVIVSILYLGNLALLYLRRTGFIQWDFIAIDAYLLFFISAIIGIWGYRKREHLYGHIMPFRPYGACLYLSLALVSLATMSYAFATANDPLVLGLEDLIIYGHLGVGFIFFLYVITNFYGLIRNNQKVYKVVYKPQGMPFIVARLAGFILVLAFFFRANMGLLFRAEAGMGIAGSDVLLAEGKTSLAEQYLIQRSLNVSPSHRAAYTLATLAEERNKLASAVNYYERAIDRHPSERAYVNLSNLYKRNDLFFDAMFALQTGVSKFPQSGPIKNNLALLFSETNVLDSAMIYLDHAMDDAFSELPATTNMMAMLARKSIKLNADSMIGVYQNATYLPVKTNVLAWFNVHQVRVQDTVNVQYFSDGVLNPHTAAYLYNFVLNQLGQGDSVSVARLVNIGNHPSNTSYQQALHFVAALQAYYNGDVERALYIIDRLQQNFGEYAGYYNGLRGKWALEQNSNRLAVDYLSKASQGSFDQAHFEHAVALTEAGLHTEALEAWSRLSSDSQTARGAVAIRMTHLLQMPVKDDQVFNLDDEAKYNLLRYRKNDLSSALTNQIVNSINQPKLKFNTLLMLAERAIEANTTDSFQEADLYINQARMLKLEGQSAFYQLNWIEKRLLYKQGDLDQLALRMDKTSAMDRENKQWEALFRAEIADKVEKNLALAEKIYTEVVIRNPLFEEGIISASSFFRKIEKDEQAYDILLRTIRLNPYASEVYKPYILLSLDLRLFSFAESSMARLKEIVSEQEFKAFEQKYQQKLNQVQQEGEEWN